MILETEKVVLIPLVQLHKSPSQPRRRHSEKLDADFVASIKAQGVIQPIVARVRTAGGWEIVFGHRRHTGSVLAGRDTIPAIVRDLTDAEVFEAQLIENVHREDMHPLDEADGFKRMMVESGRTTQQIAEKIGRPVTYVAQRLKLCELGKEVRAALDKEKITLGTAVLIARVPASLQAEALSSIRGWWSGPDTKRELEAAFLLRLDQAPFDISSATLVPKAGACSVCPKRTGMQRELFPDAARADLCTDRVCFRGKTDAVWQIRIAESKAGGLPVLEGEVAQAALNGAGDQRGGYSRLDADGYYEGKWGKLRAALKKNLPPISLARDQQTGEIFELVKTADVDKLLKRTAPARDRFSGGINKRLEEKDRLRARAVSFALAQAVANVKRLPAPALLRLVVGVLAEQTWNDDQMAILRRRNLVPEKDKGKKRVYSIGAEELLRRHLTAMTKPSDVAGLGLELSLLWIAPSRNAPAEPAWRSTLSALGVKYDVIERQLAAEAKAKKKTKAKKVTVTKKESR